MDHFDLAGCTGAVDLCSRHSVHRRRHLLSAQLRVPTNVASLRLERGAVRASAATILDACSHGRSGPVSSVRRANESKRFLVLCFTPISWAAASPSVRTFVRMVGIPTRTASSVLVDIVHPLFMMTAENTQIRYRIQLLLCHRQGDP